MLLPALPHTAIPTPCPDAQVGIVLSHSPELTRGRRMLSGKFITVLFACSDLFALG